MQGGKRKGEERTSIFEVITLCDYIKASIRRWGSICRPIPSNSGSYMSFLATLQFINPFSHRYKQETCGVGVMKQWFWTP